MKQGNQFYLTIQLEDNTGEKLDVSTIKKVQFVIGNLTKIYDGSGKEVTYNQDEECFKIWLTEEETFAFDKNIKLDARILFTNNTIGGAYIETDYWYDSLKKEILSDSEEPITTNVGE